MVTMPVDPLMGRTPIDDHGPVGGHYPSALELREATFAPRKPFMQSDTTIRLERLHIPVDRMQNRVYNKESR